MSEWFNQMEALIRGASSLTVLASGGYLYARKDNDLLVAIADLQSVRRVH